MANPANPPRQRRGGIAGPFTVLMAALAGGAVWTLIALWQEGPMTFLAVPLGVIVGLLLREHGPPHTPTGMLLGAVFSLTASVYALALIASARVAMLLGMRMTDALGRIGVEMALAVAWVRLAPVDVAWILAGAIVAAGFSREWRAHA